MSKENKQPLFYKNPVPIQKDVHSAAGLGKDINYKFAKPANSVPLNLQEFAVASRFYPIVFTDDGLSAPVAVLGLKKDMNVFVNPKGEWEKGFYIPAYIRRYPFAFTGTDDKLILCIDESSERFKKKASGQDGAFYTDDKPSEVTKSALEFCAEYQRDQKETLKFSAAIQEKGLLISRQINVVPNNSKEPIVLAGFRIIDENKLKELDEKTVIDWHKNGYLGLIYCHLLSTGNWQNLTLRV